MIPLVLLIVGFILLLLACLPPASARWGGFLPLGLAFGFAALIVERWPG